MDILFTVVALIIAGMGLYFQIKGYRRKKAISKFEGEIGNGENDRFDTGHLFDFMVKNEGKIIYLNIRFVGDENPEIDKDGQFSFSYYFNKNEKLFGGYQYLIKVNSDDDFFYDSRWISRKLKGYFKVIGISGPHMGWFSTNLKPVNIESVSVK